MYAAAAAAAQVKSAVAWLTAERATVFHEPQGRTVPPPDQVGNKGCMERVCWAVGAVCLLS